MKSERQDHLLFALARSGKRLTHAALAVILTVTFFATGLIAVSIIGQGSAPTEPSALQSAIGLVIGLLIAFLPPVFLLWGWLRFFEKRPFRTVGLTVERPLLKFARGFLVGFLMFALVTVLLGVFGLIAIENSARGLSTLGSVLIVLLAWTVQGSSEEIVVRGWLLPVVGARYGRLAAIGVSSGLFALLHVLNPESNFLSTLNIALVGVFLALYILWEEGIWGVCGLHVVWNWTQANVFGFEVSGRAYAGGILFDLQEVGPDPGV